MAKSGRFSSSRPNLQNIPKSKAMRSVFVAGAQPTLVVVDYSQLELRVMASFIPSFLEIKESAGA
jgi:DNA polymerase I-like protein with 3'-5' exonuclease and polymerase domains